MRKISSRFLAIVMCICVICCMMPLSVAAAAETATVTGETEVTMQRGVTFFGDFYSLTAPDGVTFTNIEWSVSGDLPAGITLGVNSSDGAGRSRAYLDGTPTAVTNEAVSVTIHAEATDGANTYTGSLAVSITVVDSPAHMLLDELIQNAVCEVPMATANTEEAVVAWIQNTWLPSLDGYSELVAQLDFGWTITVEAVMIDPEDELGGFTAAVAGTKVDPDGTDGTLTVRFRLDEHYNYLDNGKECIIKATECVAVRIEDDADVLDVTFTPGEGITLPDGAEVIVENHTTTIEPVASIVGSDVEIEYITIAGGEIYVSDPPVVLNGIMYYMDEIIMIDGEEYLVMNTDSHMLNLIRLSDSVQLKFDGEKLIKSKLPALKAEKRENQKVNINGVTYDVVAVRDGFSSLDIYSLYYKGIPAGKYRSETGTAAFHVGFDPATLNAQRDDIFIGRVTADNTSVANLTPGKTYNVSVIGSNDISVPGYDEALLNSIKVETEAEKTAKEELERLKADMDAKRAALDQLDATDPDHMFAWAAWHEAETAYKAALTALLNHEKATVTQTFNIPAEFIGNENVKYVAVHITNPHAIALAAAKYKMEEARADYWEYHGDSSEERQRLYEAANRASMEWAIVQEHYDAWEREHAADTGTGNELGTVTIAEDGKTLTATYEVDSFSPFTVYAFVEADEPEIKTLSATIVDADSDSNVSDNPQTGDNSHMALWIALMFISGGAVITLTVIDRKRKSTVKR